MKRVGLKSLLLIICFLAFSLKGQAITTSVVDSYNSIPPLEAQDYIFENTTHMSEHDSLHIFTGEDEGWIPRIKFAGTDKNKITTYLFCLSYHDLAPDNSIRYELAAWDTLAKMNQIRYVLENGFGNRDYSGNYDLLIEDYYITQLAIWQIQNDSGFIIDGKSINVLDDSKFSGLTEDEQAIRQRIITLVNNAKKEPINENKLVAKFVPLGSFSGYQILVPHHIYEIKIEEPKEEKHYCEVIDGTYYGRNGGVVDEYTYRATCESTTTILTKFKISYRDKCTNAAMKDVQMSLYRGSSCSGIALESWTTGSPYQINNLPEGKYSVCDAKYGNSLTFDVEETTDLQTFEFTTNPETCEPEVIPKTGVVSYTLIGGSLVLISGFYFYLRKKGVFVKIK